MNSKILVKTYKYDNSLHYAWESERIIENEEYILLKSAPPRRLFHFSRNEIYEFDDYSLEFISKTKGYTINVDIKSTSKEFYCNICDKPKIENNTVTLIDLDIDLIIDQNYNAYYVDEDEFEINKVKYKYPPEIINSVNEMKRYLMDIYTNKQFPFDGFFNEFINNIQK